MNVCFVGSGQMASAIVRGMVTRKVLPATSIMLVDPVEAQLKKVSLSCPGVLTSTTPVEPPFITTADVVFLAVKPQVAHEAFATIRPIINPEALVISVMAGISLTTIQTSLHKDGKGRQIRCIRAMPNTALIAGHGSTGYALGPTATSADESFVRGVFGSLGFCAKVNEMQMNAVTGLSGSGPAFVAMFIEALADGGVRAGLPRDLARDLAKHTVYGSSKLLVDKSVSDTLTLKEMVCSPQGTTIAGVMKLEEHGMRFATMAAVDAATQRAEQLSKL